MEDQIIVCENQTVLIVRDGYSVTERPLDEHDNEQPFNKWFDRFISSYNDES